VVEVLDDMVINEVMVRVGDSDERTLAMIALQDRMVIRTTIVSPGPSPSAARTAALTGRT